MKLLFRAFLTLFCLQCRHSYALIKIKYEIEQIEKVSILKSIIINKYQIPAKFLQIQRVSKCDHEKITTNRNLLLELCLSKDEKLMTLSQSDNIKKGAFEIFIKGAYDD